MENSNEQESEQTLPALVIFIINIFIFVTYLYLGFSSNLSDSIIGFMLFIHVGICVAFGGISKRSVWYISAAIVALPLISLIFSYL